MTPELLHAARQFTDASDAEVTAIASIAGRYARVLDAVDATLPKAWLLWRLPAVGILTGLMTRAFAQETGASRDDLAGLVTYGFQVGLQPPANDALPEHVTVN